jgi:hypothetical protein
MYKMQVLHSCRQGIQWPSFSKSLRNIILKWLCTFAQSSMEGYDIREYIAVRANIAGMCAINHSV